MIEIEEGDLKFSFPDHCEVGEYEQWSFFRNQFQSVAGGTKAVDILCLAEDSAWLVEVKDYRRHPRMKTIDLGDEIGTKMRDTLSGLAAASANANDDEERTLVRRVLAKRRWRVALHLEQPLVRSRLRPTPFGVTEVALKLRGQLKPVDAYLLVLDRHTARADIPWTVQ